MGGKLKNFFAEYFFDRQVKNSLSKGWFCVMVNTEFKKCTAPGGSGSSFPAEASKFIIVSAFRQ